MPTRTLLGIAGVAFLVRLWYALAVMRHRVLGYDALWYQTMAGNLADGLGFQVTYPLIPWHDFEPTAKYGPLWPSVLSVAAFVGQRTPTELRMVSAVAGAASCFLIGRLGATLVSRRVGIVAAALAAFYPMLVAADGSLMSETLYLLLFLVLLNVLASSSSGLSIRRAVALGVVIGLAALTRGEGLFLGPLVLAVWLLARRVPPRRALAVLGVAGLAAAVVVAPWVIRTSTTFHKPLFTTNASIVISGGNCESTYYGDLFGGWDLFCLREYRPEFEGLDEAQRAAIYQREGIDYVTSHKARLPVVAAARLARIWGVTRGEQLRWEANETKPLGALQLGWWTYVAMVPLAAAAAWRLGRARRLPVLLVTPVLVVSVLGIATYGSQRVRFAAEPSLVILAACSLVWIWEARHPPSAAGASGPGSPPTG